jgi:gliding motility-associated-like protein
VYNVKLKVTDSYGCSDSLTRNLYITVDKPRASFTVNDSISSCLPFEVQFTNTSTYYKSSLWTFGDGGTSSATNPVHYYSNTGTYNVRLLITSPGGCLDSAFIPIRTFDTVGSRVNYIPLGGCRPLNVNLNTFTTGPMASYFWDFGDGYTATSTTPNINHIYRSYGNYLPKIIMQDQTGCLLPLQGIDTVFVTGSTTKFGYNDSLFCDRGTVNFTDSTTFNDPIVRYNWNFGDGNTSPLQNPPHTFTSPGLYTIRLITQTQLGCLDTLTKPIVIRVVQSPITNIGGDSVFCVNSTKLYSGLFVIPDTSVVKWQWIFPNGNTSILQNPPPQTFNTAGTFTVISIATNSTGCIDTTRKTILINPLPVVTMPGQMTVQAGFPVTIPATYSPNTISWLWSPSAGLSCTTCATPDAGPKVNTNFLVYFTDTNGCSNIGSVLVTVICKNANLYMPNTFSPNGDGSNEIFYPRGKGIDRIKMLRIFNRWGEVVFEKYNFPVNDVSSGWNGSYKGRKPQSDTYIYQVEVFCDNGDTLKLSGNISLML